MKFVAPLLFLAISTNLTANKLNLDFVHKEWATTRLQVDDKSIFRAFTVSSDGSNAAILTVDRDIDDCNWVKLAATQTFSIPHKQQLGIHALGLFGQIRVDKKPIRNINYNIVVETDSSVKFVVTNYDREKELFDELLYGQTLRLKLTNDDSNLFQRFSLAGSAAALVKSREQCLSLTHDPDIKYPNIEPPLDPFDDASYF